MTVFWRSILGFPYYMEAAIYALHGPIDLLGPLMSFTETLCKNICLVSAQVNLDLQKPIFCRFPMNSILNSTMGPYKKVGFGRLRKAPVPCSLFFT